MVQTGLKHFRTKPNKIRESNYTEIQHSNNKKILKIGFYLLSLNLMSLIYSPFCKQAIVAEQGVFSNIVGSLYKRGFCLFLPHVSFVVPLLLLFAATCLLPEPNARHHRVLDESWQSRQSVEATVLTAITAIGADSYGACASPPSFSYWGPASSTACTNYHSSRLVLRRKHLKTASSHKHHLTLTRGTKAAQMKEVLYY